MARVCGGTPARPAMFVAGIVVAKAEPGKEGCGHAVVEIPVDDVVPDDAERPLFLKPDPVIACVHCDSPGAL